jgi:hypothetical protein
MCNIIMANVELKAILNKKLAIKKETFILTTYRALLP